MALIDDDEDRVDAAVQSRQSKRPSAAQNLGTATRGITGGGASPLPASPTGVIGAVNSITRAATRPVRDAVRGGLQDFGRGLSGETAARPDFSGVRSTANTVSRGPSPSPSPAAAGPDFSGVTAEGNSTAVRASQSRPKPGDLNTFTGSNGITRQITPAAGEGVAAAPAAVAMPLAARPDPIIAARSAAPDVQDSTARAVGSTNQATRLAQGAAGDVVTDAFSPNAEMLRRLAISQSSAQFDGSPSARAAMARAITGQIDAGNAAVAAGQGAVNNILQDGARDENLSNERFAERRQAARVTGADNALRQQEMQSNERISRRPQVTTTAGGGIGLIRDDASFTPVTGADGQQVRAQAAEGGLTAPDLLQAYSEQRAAIVNGLGEPEDKAAQLAALDADPLFAPLRAGVAQGGTAAGQSGEAPPVAGAQKAPDGRWYVQNDDGSYSVVNP